MFKILMGKFLELRSNDPIYILREIFIRLLTFDRSSKGCDCVGRENIELKNYSNYVIIFSSFEEH